MLNYVSAELYKVLRRKYTWITLAVVLTLEGLLVGGYVFINVNGSHIDFAEGLSTAFTMMFMGCYFTLITTDMVYADQYKQSTLKNEVSFGIPRTTIYLGKFLVMLAVSVLFMVAMLGFFAALSYAALPHDPEEDLLVLSCLGECVLGALPVWIGIQALSCACVFLIRNSVAAMFIALGPFAVFTTVIKIAGLLLQDFAAGTVLMSIYQWMPMTMLENLPDTVGHPEEYWPYFGRLCLVGGAWFAVSTAAGLIGFHKKEIN